MRLGVAFVCIGGRCVGRRRLAEGERREGGDKSPYARLENRNRYIRFALADVKDEIIDLKSHESLHQEMKSWVNTRTS